MKTLTAAFLLLAPLSGLAQSQTNGSQTAGSQPTSPTKTTAPETGQTDSSSAKVTVTARGSDIRVVLTNIFAQAKRSMILQSNISYSLYLSLQDTDFAKAVDVICEQSGLKYEIRDGIYHIYKKGVATAPTSEPAAPAAQPFQAKPDSFSTPTPSVPATKGGKLSLSVLKRKVTTKLAKAPIGAVLEELGSQAGVKIELGENVPAYRLDAVLNHTTLRYALEQVTRAAKLTYSFTDHHSILVDSRS